MKLRCNVTNWLPQPAKVVFFFSCFQVELEALPVVQPGLKTMAGADSATKLYLLVRKLVFTCVYYNNGNSLPFFPIPSSWEYSNKSTGRGKAPVPYLSHPQWQTRLSIRNLRGCTCNSFAQSRSSSLSRGWAPAKPGKLRNRRTR